MRYSEMLKNGLVDRGMSLQQLCFQLAKHEIWIDKASLSKMQNGKLPPASDEANKVIGLILALDTDQFRLAAARERIPNELYQLIKDAG